MTVNLTPQNTRFIQSGGGYGLAYDPSALSSQLTVPVLSSGSTLFAPVVSNGSITALTITGTGFGTGPTVLLDNSFGDMAVGALSNPSQYGDPHDATGLYPPVEAGWWGINGIGIREGGTNAATDNRICGYVKSFTAASDYFEAFEMCIPDGRHFSGASSPLTGPPASNLKMSWSLDGPFDTNPEADSIAMSRVNPGEWATAGNNTGPTVYFNPSVSNTNSNFIDFDGWMSFSTCRIAGSPDPSVDNGITEQAITNSLGTFTNKRINAAVFSGSSPNYHYTHVNFPGWSGNNSQDLTQHLFSYHYRANGVNCGKRVEVTNSATYSAATRRRVVAHNTWADTLITVNAPAWKLSGMTHWFVIDTGTIIDSGLISEATGWTEGVAPTLSGYTGTWAEGNTITISGTNLSTETTESLFTDFTGDTLGQFPSGFTDWNDFSSKYTVVDDGTPPIGQRSIRLSAINQAMGTSTYEYSTDQDEIFVECWIRLNKQSFVSESQPGVEQVKLVRIVNGTGTSSMQSRPTRIDCTYLKSSGLAAGYSQDETGNPSYYAKNSAGQDWTPNDTDWYKLIMYFKLGTEGQSDGAVLLKYGDAEYFRYSGQTTNAHMASPSATVAKDSYQSEPIVTHNATNSGLKPRRVALPYFHRDDQETIVDISRFYTANSRERVVVGDASTWSACDKTKVYMVETVSRSTTQAQVKAANSSTIAGSKWLYAINHDGMVNENGVAV